MTKRVDENSHVAPIEHTLLARTSFVHDDNTMIFFRFEAIVFFRRPLLIDEREEEKMFETTRESTS